MTDDLDRAFDELIQAVQASRQHVREHPFFAEPENRVPAYAFLVGMMMARFEEDVIFGPDLPFFRVLDPRIREGGDNPDQRYLISRLNGGDTYRIWGTRGSARRLDFQIYAGDPYVAGSGGRAASFLTFEQMTFDEDGSFEVIASPRRPGTGAGEAPNWIENPPDATRVLVRQVFSEWADDLPGEVHIDRAGHEGDSMPPLDDAAMATRLRNAAKSLVRHTRVWPEMVQKGYIETSPPNTVSVPFDPGSRGGVPGRYMCHGIFDLAPDEALVVTTWPARGNYQGIQLADLWFSSLEYANRQTSLAGDQAHRTSDGAYRFVIAAEDPGVPNWLDTVGRRRGVILLRYDGMTGPFDPSTHPTAAKVPLASLRDHLPEDTPTFTPAERRAAIAARRRHVQRRFGT
jgi:hypothetical protein